MKAFKVLIVFLIINFGALAMGGWLMNNGPQTDWYLALNKAPWTPPGWVFGALDYYNDMLFNLYDLFVLVI